MIRELAEASAPKHLGTSAYRSQWKKAFEAGFIAASQNAINYLEAYRKSYSEDLCPPRDLEEFDPEIRTVIAFHMGRFLIDKMIKDARAALEDK